MNDNKVEGWIRLGKVKAHLKNTEKYPVLYCKEILGKVRYKIVTDTGDYIVAKNPGNTLYNHRAGNYLFNLDE